MKSKKGLLLLFIVQLILALSLGISAAEAAPANDITFTAETPSVVKAGETVTVTIAIKDNKGFALAMPKLSYNDEVVEFKSSTIGTAFDASLVGVINNSTSKKVTITIGDENKIQDALAGKIPAYTATGTVAVLTFQVKNVAADVTDVFSLEIANYIIGNAGENVVAETTPLKVVGKNHAHTEAIDAAVPATCTTDGLTEGKHCSYCEAVLTAQNVVPAFGHDYKTYASNGNGTHTKVCANDATHTETENCAGSAPACEAKAVCDACKTEFGDVLGHTPGSAATCTAAQTCTVCGKELAPAKGHTPVVIPAVEPTYSSEGATEGSKCSECDTILVAPEVIEAKSTLWIWIVVIVSVVVVAGAVVAVILIKKKKS